MTAIAIRRGRLDGSLVIPLALALLTAPVLAMLPFPRNVVGVVVGLAFVLATIRPPIGAAMLVAGVPLQSIADEDHGPVNVTVIGLILLAVAAALLVRILTERRALRLDRVTLTLAVYVAVLALSVVNAVSWTAWMTEVYRWWSTLLAYAIALNAIDGPRQARPALVATALGVAATSCYGIVQAVEGWGPEAFELNGIMRAHATFGQPNPFAAYLALTVPLLVALAGAWLLPTARPSLRITIGGPVSALAAGAAGLGLVALLLTQSRGGWIGAGVGLGAVAWLLGGRVRWAAVGLALAVLGAIVLTPYGARIVNRLGAGFGLRSDGVLVTPENFAVQERIAHWRAGWAMAERYPLLGVGAGNFPERYREFTKVWRFRIPRGHAHNAYIEVAAQSGLVGLAAYLGLIGAVAERLVRNLRTAGDPAARALVVGAIGVGLAFAIHNMFDYLHVVSLPVQLAAALAMAASVEHDATGRRAAGAHSTLVRPAASGLPVG